MIILFRTFTNLSLFSFPPALSQFLAPSSPSSDVILLDTFSAFLSFSYLGFCVDILFRNHFFFYFCYCFISFHFISSVILRGHTVPHCSYFNLRLTSCNYFTSSCSCARWDSVGFILDSCFPSLPAIYYSA